MPQESSQTYDRRQLLNGITATAGVTALAGCNIPDVLGDNKVSLPPFISGWSKIQKSGDAKVVLQFDGDIVNKIASIPIPVSELIRLVTGYDVPVERQSVDIEETENLPDSETVEGVIQEAAFVESWPDASFYKIPRAVIPEEKTITAAGQDLIVELPADDPTLYIAFPSGYKYTLPDMHDDVSRQPIIDVQRESGGLFDYDENPKHHTLPTVAHYDKPDAVWMRAASEYRFKWLRKMSTFYDTDYYVENQFTRIREAAQAISEDLAESAIESVLTSPLPTTVTAPLDIKGINDAVTNDYSEFEQALESISTIGSLFTENHQRWMNPLVYTDTEQENNQSSPEKDQDMITLGQLARNEYRVMNPLLVSSPDQDLFRSNLSRYRSILEEQQNILNYLLFDSSFNPAREFENADPYWENLHTLAATFLREAKNMIDEEISMIDSIESRFF